MSLKVLLLAIIFILGTSFVGTVGPQPLCMHSYHERVGLHRGIETLRKDINTALRKERTDGEKDDIEDRVITVFAIYIRLNFELATMRDEARDAGCVLNSYP